MALLSAVNNCKCRHKCVCKSLFPPTVQYSSLLYFVVDCSCFEDMGQGGEVSTGHVLVNYL